MNFLEGLIVAVAIVAPGVLFILALICITEQYAKRKEKE